MFKFNCEKDKLMKKNGGLLISGMHNSHFGGLETNFRPLKVVISRLQYGYSYLICHSTTGIVSPYGDWGNCR